MKELIEAKLRQAEEQVGHWRGKAAEAERLAVMWEGAALALRGLLEEAKTAEGEADDSAE